MFKEMFGSDDESYSSSVESKPMAHPKPAPHVRGTEDSSRYLQRLRSNSRDGSTHRGYRQRSDSRDGNSHRGNDSIQEQKGGNTSQSVPEKKPWLLPEKLIISLSGETTPHNKYPLFIATALHRTKSGSMEF